MAAATVCTRRDIDRVAAHACPERSRRIVSLDHRKAKKMRLEVYREAWHLLEPTLTIHACRDENCPDEDYPESYNPEQKHKEDPPDGE